MFKLVTSIPGRSESAYVHIPREAQFYGWGSSLYRSYTEAFSELSGKAYYTYDHGLIWNREYFLLPANLENSRTIWCEDGIWRYYSTGYRKNIHATCLKDPFPVLAKKIDWDVIRFQEFFGS
jgi:hypothetical protein